MNSDRRDGSMKRLLVRAKSRGYFLEADLDELLPPGSLSPEEREDFKNLLIDFGFPYFEKPPSADELAKASAPATQTPKSFGDPDSVPLDADCTDDRPIVILAVGAEGGDLRLIGQRTPSGWRYRYSLIDQSAAWLDEGHTESRRQSPWVTDWREALSQLDRYPWARLYPLKVHPAYRSRVEDAVRRRLADPAKPLGRWAGILAARR